MRAAILTDTVNLSPGAKKVTPKDVEMVEKIEAVIGGDKEDRESIFRQISLAKSDVSAFNTLQLLQKDLKVSFLVSIWESVSFIYAFLGDQ